MKIECPHCKKAYNIPEDRIRKFGEHVVFPCPSCKGRIEVELGTGRQPETPAQATPAQPAEPAGEVLKKRILKTVSDLPPMPQVAQKARELTLSEKSSFSDLARIIETDQAIATRVLKIANSSYYGVMGNVSSIQHASVVLGMKTLNELLTLACASTLLGSELKGYGMNAGDLWRHSLATAGCARSIAGKKNPGMVDDAFSAGLIHDCGKLILDRYVDERKPAFETFMQDGQRSFLDAEKNLLGFDHAQIAAEVCEKWQIPKKLISSIQYHHSPSQLRSNELAHIVHAADAIALMSGIGAGFDGMMYQIDAKAMEFLGLDSTQISMLMAEAAEYVEKTLSSL
jgi:putative nucleotidyltransferase with HDIG domain